MIQQCRAAVLVPEPQEPQELEADNRRYAPRINRQVDVRYRMHGGGVEDSVALNISRTGARIVLRGVAKAFHNEMTLQIDRQVDVLARSVWEQPMPGGHCRIAGVTFEAVGPLQQAAIDRLLSSLQG